MPGKKKRIGSYSYRRKDGKKVNVSSHTRTYHTKDRQNMKEMDKITLPGEMGNNKKDKKKGSNEKGPDSI